jgi:DNA replication and repair protein RecF
MHIKSLITTNFRNLTSALLRPGTGVNVFYGDNGSGKSNLLEAIFTLCLGRSQRTASDTVLVNADAELFRLEGSIESAGIGAEITVAYQRGGRKKITLDSVTIRTSELYDRTCLVASGPEDSEILPGPPSARRLFLDLYLSQLSQTYLADLSDYQKALSQKNAALRQEMDPTPFDPLLVASGSKVMLERSRFLKELSVLAAGYYGEIADGEAFGTEYRPKVALDSDNADLESLTVAFEKALDRYAERERVMQTSLVGPHRDDVEFEIAGRPARTHGSQGQWRTAAIALKLGVYELLKQKRGSAPILLLDEIFAELDNDRAERLAGEFLEAGQLFLTTAVEPPESLSHEAKRFRVVAGTVVEEN